MLPSSAKPIGAHVLTKLLLAFVAAIFVLLAAVPANSADDHHKPPPDHPPPSDEGSQSGHKGGSADGEGDSGSGDNPHGGNPPGQEGDDGDDASNDNASNDDSGTSINIGSGPRLSQIESKFKRTKKELSRLFMLSDTEIEVQFPEGGFDEALVRAASRARRAEKAYERRVNRD